MLAGLPWLRSAAAAPRAQRNLLRSRRTVAPDRVVWWRATSDEYQALAIPKTYQSDRRSRAPLADLPRRPVRCAIAGSCANTRRADPGQPGAIVMEEQGVTETASVAADGREAVRRLDAVRQPRGHHARHDVGGRRHGDQRDYADARDPSHPDGRVASSRSKAGGWAGDVIVLLPSSMGLALTDFRPAPRSVRSPHPRHRGTASACACPNPPASPCAWKPHRKAASWWPRCPLPKVPGLWGPRRDGLRRREGHAMDVRLALRKR
jgi:hypothetical protein